MDRAPWNHPSLKPDSAKLNPATWSPGAGTCLDRVLLHGLPTSTSSNSVDLPNVALQHGLHNSKICELLSGSIPTTFIRMPAHSHNFAVLTDVRPQAAATLSTLGAHDSQHHVAQMPMMESTKRGRRLMDERFTIQQQEVQTPKQSPIRSKNCAKQN